ncbi:MAG: hypothetical protein IKA99_00030, partial [Clostridia bacterium]|nr:hypothetical protein [Clostridia bacterium]
THSLDNQLVTTRNIGEMMPGAITPLSISTSVLAIDYGMRYMLKTVGVYKNVNDVPDFSMAFAYKYHLFINMTQLHKMGKRVMLATPHDMNLSVMGEDIDNYPETDMKKACAFTRLINSIKMVKYLFSSGKTRTKLTKLCDDLVFSADDTSVQAIYDEITEKLATLNKSLCYHYVCSSFSGSMNSALTSAVSKDFKDKSTLQTFISSVLSDIDGIESANILESLRNIGTLVKQKNPDAVNYDEDKLLAYLSDENNEEVNSIYKEFLARHGHRSIKEAEMRSKAWKNDPKRLMRNLHTVMLADYTETKNNAFDMKKVLKEYGYSKSPMIKWFVKKARNAVVDREYSKSQIIRVIDKFKDRYSLLAKLLTEAKLISDEDCIYFMSHKEIGELIAGNTSLKKKCITRRAKFKEAEQISFPDIVIGTPKPVEVSMENVESVSGITVCKGKVYGRAHVVHSVADAETLKDGEVMVAAYTDIGWSPYYSLISALITEVGSTLSHGAVVAREYCLPTIVNVKNATQLIHDGDCLMVDADNATISIISEADFEKVAVTA